MNEKSGEKLPWGLKEVAPGSIKSLSQKELEAFELGILNQKKKHLSKKEQEELKKKQEDEAAALILKDFVASFENSNNKAPKIFIKGSVINPSTKEEKVTSDKGILYSPAFKLVEKSNSTNNLISTNKYNSENLNNEANIVKSLETKRKTSEKKTSNLELFKEELKRLQMERDEKNKKKQNTKYRDNDKNQDIKNPKANNEAKFEIEIENDSSQDSIITSASFSQKANSVEDPSTTNIFISNLSPKTVEQDLVHRFGKYGLLASVKIMWPRTDEEKNRNANCGFVAFMSRKDAELALQELDGCLENGLAMRLSWSKAITLPSKPYYIPDEIADIITPPPQSGLPFNAQKQNINIILETSKNSKSRKKTKRNRRSSLEEPETSSFFEYLTDEFDESSDTEKNILNEICQKELNQILNKTIIRVIIPTDRILLGLIHRTIEFVIKEGPIFEALLMTKEIKNPQYRFLFDNQSSCHSYYRWKLFSILNGDSFSYWRTKPFKMFKNGSYWIPPPINRYTSGCSDETYKRVRKEILLKREKLSTKLRDTLDEKLKKLTIERKSISEAMIFCIENAEQADYIVETIIDYFKNLENPLNKAIARLYLLSDILYNCIVKVANVSFYRNSIEKILPTVFGNLHQMYMKVDSKMKRESFKQKVLLCIRAWEEWAIYPNDYLVNLQSRFLGVFQVKSENIFVEVKEEEIDVDGQPFEDDEKNKKSLIENDNESKSKFLKCKWETVDPEKLEKQAITTSKWDFFDDQNEQLMGYRYSESYLSNDKNKNIESEEDIDGKPLEDEEFANNQNNNKSILVNKVALIDNLLERNTLREIELKTLKYIDHIENCKDIEISDLNVQKRADIFRSKLIHEALEKNLNSDENKFDKIREENEESRSVSVLSSSSSSDDFKNMKKKRKSDSISPNRTNKSSYTSCLYNTEKSPYKKISSKKY